MRQAVVGVTRLQVSGPEDAIRIVLNEALREAGFVPMRDQTLPAEVLEAAVVDGLLNDDMTLMEACRSAVRQNAQRLVKEVAVCGDCGGD